MAKNMKYCKQHGKFDACAEERGNPPLSKAYQPKPKPGDPGFMGHAIKNANKRHRAALKAQKEATEKSNAFSKSAATLANGVATGKYDPRNMSTENRRRIGDGLVGAGALAGTAAFVPKKLRPGAALATTAGGAMYAGTKIHQKANEKDEAMSKRDDGIRHLTSTSRITRSPENRGTGSLVPCEYGNREMDGTPMTGRDGAARQIRPENKMGNSAGTKPVGTSAIKEQIPGHGKKRVAKAADPFEISKDDKKPFDPTMGGQMSSGRRLTTQLFPGIHGAVAGKQGKKVRSFGNEAAGAFGGSVVGHAAGVGAALALKKPRAAAMAGSIGNAAGGVTGTELGMRRNAKKGYYNPINKAADSDPFEVFGKRDFSQGQRNQLARKGDALPDGKLPIKTKGDLKNAEKLKGKVKGEPPAEVNAYIDEKKKELSKSANGVVEDAVKAGKHAGTKFKPVSLMRGVPRHSSMTDPKTGMPIKKSSDPFEVEKAFGEIGEAVGQGAKMMGASLKPIIKKPPVIGGAIGAGAGGVLGGNHKVRNAAVGGGLGAAGTLGAMKLLKA